MIRTGTQPTTVVTPQQDIQPNKGTDGHLGAINGRAAVGDGSKPVGGQSALDPTGTTHLAAVTGKAPLAKISDRVAPSTRDLNRRWRPGSISA